MTGWEACKRYLCLLYRALSTIRLSRPFKRLSLERISFKRPRLRIYSAWTLTIAIIQVWTLEHAIEYLKRYTVVISQ
jgi:hypothetical protein